MSATALTSSESCAHFLLGPEHEAFRREVRRFVEDVINPIADECETSGRIPRKIFEQAGAQGLFGLCVPEAYGGSGGDCRKALVMAEETARCRSRGVAMGLGAHTGIAMPHLVRFGTDGQKNKYLAD